MSEKNIEKQTSLWMGLFILVMALMYILASLGKVDWLRYIAVIFGFFLAGFLFIQSGIRVYFQRQEYKKISIGDFVVFATIIFAAGILINSFLLIEALKNISPNWLLSFSRVTGIIAGTGAGILAVVHLLLPRFK